MNGTKIKSKILKGAGFDAYFPHQEQIIEKLWADAKNAIIQAPTSSGKTLAISPFLYNEFLKNKSTVYAVPSKAMLYDKINEIQTYFSEFEKKPVICRVGDDNAWRNGDILVGTFEQVYSASIMQNSLSQIDNIILDDFHVLYSENRGFTLEKLITYMITSENLRIICLSATISPLNILSKWINDATVVSFGDEVRPVKIINKTFEIIRTIDVLSVKEAMPALVFCFTRNSTRSRCKELYEYAIKMKVSPCNNKKELLGKRNLQELDVDEREILNFMEYGFAYHNAQLENKTKDWIENIFKDGKLKYLFTTSTLAYGINLPAKTVFIYDIFTWRDGGSVLLPKHDWLQMIGRAGRTGFQKEGIAYTCYKKQSDKQKIEDLLFNGTLDNVESAINHDDYFKKALLDLIGSNHGNETYIMSFFSNTLFNAVSDDSIFEPRFNLKSAIQKQLIWLSNNGFIERRTGISFVLTDFGKQIFEFLHRTYVDYRLNAFKSLDNFLKQRDMISPDGLVSACIRCSGDGTYRPLWLTPGKKDIENCMRKDSAIVDQSAATLHVLLSEHGWINNRSTDEIFSWYEGMWATYIKTINENIAEFVVFGKELADYNGIKIDGDIDTLIECIRYGVSPNFLSTIKLKKIGRKTVVSIYNELPKLVADVKFEQYYKDDFLKALNTLNDTRLNDVLLAIPLIGKYRCKKIKDAIMR